MNAPFVSPSPQGAHIRIRLSPKSSKEAIEGLHGDALKVKVKAPPVDGQANKALIKYLAKQLKVSASRIEITSGHTNRNKVLLVRDLSPEEATRRLSI